MIVTKKDLLEPIRNIVTGLVTRQFDEELLSSAEPDPEMFDRVLTNIREALDKIKI